MTWMTRPALPAASGHAGMSGEDMPDMTIEPGGAMPGYATTAQIEALEAATGDEANRLFLELMIAHHRGGIEMADALLARSTDELVTPLARAIVVAQQSDIDYMEELLGRF